MISRFRGEYEWLSNFYSSPFIDDEKHLAWANVECYFQSRKTTSFALQQLLSTNTDPMVAKHIGHCIILRKNWNDLRLKFMYKGLQYKFDQNHDLAFALVATAPEKIVEVNMWHDNFWGDCDCEQCHDIPGQNHLGLLLMKVRDNLI